MGRVGKMREDFENQVEESGLNATGKRKESLM